MLTTHAATRATNCNGFGTITGPPSAPRDLHVGEYLRFYHPRSATFAGIQGCVASPTYT